LSSTITHHGDKDRDNSSSYSAHDGSLYDSELPLGGSAHSLRNQLSTARQPPQPVHHLVMTSSGKPQPASYMDPRGAAVSSPERSSILPAAAYEYASSRSGNRQMSPPTSYRGGGPVLASDDRYPLMQSASVDNPLSRTRPPTAVDTRPPTASTAGTRPSAVTAAGLPRYGSPTFPPPTSRDGAGNRNVPLSVAASGVHNVAGAVRRPVSFVRAVEQSEQLAAGAVSQTRAELARAPLGGARVAVPQTTAELDERTANTGSSAYGSSYEIAV